jgi:3-(3-hydroxy-phenyl)propionate hydroxylase
MGLSFEGQTFEEQFLIADVEMDTSPFGDAAVPERWFWFDPKFHNGKSALLHQQPDNIYRIDLQLDVDADAKEESKEENVLPRLDAILGDKPYRLDWVSVYKFRCIRLDEFVHGRVIFVGDSAHVVSPFGARGGNGGIQDVDNLGWKLAAVIKGDAKETLLDSYNEERVHGSEENILNSARATNFMTPKTDIEALFRAQTLKLAKDHPFARKLINSGRLSTPCALTGKTLQSDTPAPQMPGTAAVDAPLKNGWLLTRIHGAFTVVAFDAPAPDCPASLRSFAITADEDSQGLARARYGAGWTYLFRPDGHICAAWETPPSSDQIGRAHQRALGN